MNRSKLFKVIPGLIALGLGMVAVMFFVIKLLWAWTVPDLFPGAVGQGLVAAEITWLTSFKLALFIALINGARINSSKNN